MSTAQPLSYLLRDLAVPVPELAVTGVSMDSRQVERGGLFLACRSVDGRSHGLDHLDQALARGAAAVAWELVPGHDAPQAIGVPVIAVPELRRHAGAIAARCYGEPSATMDCIGVTGTDGKTSTAWLLAQALAQLDTPCAYIGTLGSGIPPQLDAATQTTPDPVALQRLLARLHAQGARACAMEVSSHALDQDRARDVDFRITVLTNVSRDHLDYHGTPARYAAAKRRLFAQWPKADAVLNRDDAQGAQWVRELAASQPVTVYGIDGEIPQQLAGAASGLRYVLARAPVLDDRGLGFDIDSSWGRAQLRSPLLGRFNVYNLLAVLACLLLRGVTLARAVEALATLRTVPGRIEAYRGAQPGPVVVVDYAHTPEALRQVLQALRAHADGALVCVFGCGGDRDAGKRPLMGAVAAELADRVLVTDDNPRGESPEAIVEQILAGVTPSLRDKVSVRHDRAEAIRSAVAAAAAGDVVLVAGKGHEDYQIYGSERRSFSDRVFVAGLLGTVQ